MFLQRIAPSTTCPLAPSHDAMLMSTSLDAGRRDHSLPELALYWLRVRPPSLARLAHEAELTRSSTTKRRINPQMLPAAVVRYACQKSPAKEPYVTQKRPAADTHTHTHPSHYAGGLADISLRLYDKMWPALALEGVAGPYQLMELPLVDVLARMEARGVAVDRQMLEELSGKYAEKIHELERQIWQLAGREFAISSPKQLAVVLFEELRLPRRVRSREKRSM
jgi:DNA polymerase I-like protein with 3'-5' exonuclease and polymerase domains